LVQDLVISTMPKMSHLVREFKNLFVSSILHGRPRHLKEMKSLRTEPCPNAGTKYIQEFPRKYTRKV